MKKRRETLGKQGGYIEWEICLCNSCRLSDWANQNNTGWIESDIVISVWWTAGACI